MNFIKNILAEEVPLVREVLTRKFFYLLLFVLFFFVFNLSFSLFTLSVLLIFILILALCIVIDIKHFILPDILTLPGIILGLIFAPWALGVSLPLSLSGALVGYFLFFSLAYLFLLTTKREGLGLGDVKFFAMLGAWCGLHMLPFIMLIASFSALIYFIFRGIIKGIPTSQKIPFGPFLATGGYICLLFGVELWHMVFKLRSTISEGIFG